MTGLRLDTGPRIPLIARKGDLSAKAGQVIEGLDIDGTVYVDAPGVTIRDCRLRGGRWFAVQTGKKAAGLLVEHCDIGPDVQGGADGISGERLDFTVRASNFHHLVDAMKLGGGLAEGNWIHDLGPREGAHHDGIQILSANGTTTVRGNRIQLGNTTGLYNAAVFVKADLGPVADVVIDDNDLDGGSYTVAFSGTPKYGPPTSVVLTGNRFGRNGRYGQISHDIGTRLTSVGNVWADTELPI